MGNSTTLTLQVILISLLTFKSTQNYASSKTENMKISTQQTAPTFSVKDVFGATVNLKDYKGKKILLSFYRNVGCPICNLRFHEIQKQAEYFKSKGLVILAIYESTLENMQQYVEGQTFYATMIPNPDLSLYRLYNIERSYSKLMLAMFHGAMGKMMNGKKLFSKKIKEDGNMNRIEADFLIDENGIIKLAYYGKYIGDHLPIDTIKQFIN